MSTYNKGKKRGTVIVRQTVEKNIFERIARYMIETYLSTNHECIVNEKRDYDEWNKEIKFLIDFMVVEFANFTLTAK